MQHRSRTPYTAAEQAAPIPNMADVRVFADVSQSRFIKGVCTHLIAAADRAAEPAYLALSGGGNGGAYGAGVLNGWSASGTRPEFVLVGGIYRRHDRALCFSGPELRRRGA